MENAPADLKSLTELQSAFVRHYVDGASQTEAARMAGYAAPHVEATRLMRLPHIQAVVQAELVRRVQTLGTQVAANFLINTINNEKAPWSARVESAKVIMNKGPLADKILANQSHTGGKQLAEMSAAELQQFIDGGLKAIDDKRRAEAIDVEVIRDNAPTSDITPAK